MQVKGLDGIGGGDYVFASESQVSRHIRFWCHWLTALYSSRVESDSLAVNSSGSNSIFVFKASDDLVGGINREC